MMSLQSVNRSIGQSVRFSSTVKVITDNPADLNGSTGSALNTQLVIVSKASTINNKPGEFIIGDGQDKVFEYQYDWAKSFRDNAVAIWNMIKGSLK